MTMIAGLVIGGFFLSSNITGFVIGSLSNNFSNILGVGILLTGLVLGFLLRKK